MTSALERLTPSVPPLCHCLLVWEWAGMPADGTLSKLSHGGQCNTPAGLLRPRASGAWPGFLISVGDSGHSVSGCRARAELGSGMSRVIPYTDLRLRPGLALVVWPLNPRVILWASCSHMSHVPAPGQCHRPPILVLAFRAEAPPLSPPPPGPRRLCSARLRPLLR